MLREQAIELFPELSIFEFFPEIGFAGKINKSHWLHERGKENLTYVNVYRIFNMHLYLRSMCRCIWEKIPGVSQVSLGFEIFWKQEDWSWELNKKYYLIIIFYSLLSRNPLQSTQNSAFIKSVEQSMKFSLQRWICEVLKALCQNYIKHLLKKYQGVHQTQPVIQHLISTQDT